MRKSLYGFFGFLLFALYLGPVHAEQLVLYDDFRSDSNLIDPLKWLGEEANEGRIVRENVRQITGRGLKMKIVGYSNTNSNEGSEIGTTSLIHTRGELVNDIMATINVNEFSISACASNPNGYKFARARLTAPLFNVGESIPNSAVDDIYAQFRVLGSPNDSNLKVITLVQHCKDADCNSADTLLYEPVLTIGINTPVILRIRWDKDNNNIIFYYKTKKQKSFKQTVFNYSNLYSDDSKLATLAWRKKVDVSMGLANCEDTMRPSSIIEAIFENIYVNESAAPTQ